MPPGKLSSEINILSLKLPFTRNKTHATVEYELLLIKKMELV